MPRHAGGSSDGRQKTAGTLAWFFAGLGVFGNALDAFGVDGDALFVVRYGVGILFAISFVSWLGLWLNGRYAARRRRSA